MMKREEVLEVKREGRADPRSKASAVLRTRPHVIAWIAVAAAALAVSLWALGVWLALRLDRRVDALDAGVRLVRADVGALQGRTARSERRLSQVGKRLRAIGHPLRPAFSWPVSGPLLEPYGPRGSGWHAGIDVDAPEGAPVRAAAPGVVVHAGWEDGYGNRVVVAHGRRLETVYAHLDTITVDPGTLVTDTAQVGTLGCTGTCNGAHLHFETRVDGVASDPLLWLPPDQSRVTALTSAG
jgi:murein DD-endopeptidase MepM/ murein hydrolase activator NlpD